MVIRLRDTDMKEVGILRIKDDYSIDDKKCTNLTHTDTDDTGHGEIVYTFDFLENKPLQKVSTRALLEEIERRIGTEK